MWKPRYSAEAFVPGRYSFLGGCGLFITKTTSDEQQAYAWELMKDMIDKASVYALVQRSPPPYEVGLLVNAAEGRG